MFVLEITNPRSIILHLHGFASNVKSSKVKSMLENLRGRASFFAMDMDYHTTTTTKTLDLLDTLVKGFRSKGFDIILSGSSHGAYVSLNYVRFYKEGIKALFLFAPSYSTLELTIKQEGLEKCKMWLEGKEELHIYECELGLDFYINKGFAVDVLQKGYEIVRGQEVFFPASSQTPILIAHGRQDSVVPVEYSRLFVSRVDVKEYLEVDDDHRLSNSFGEVFEGFLTQTMT